MGGVYIGPSGWSYKHWKDGFFKGVPQRKWLEHCTTQFTGIEVNATYYRHLNPSVYAGWRERTPEGFAFAVKGHRYVTHIKKLKDVGEKVNRMRESLAVMGDRLRVVFWQLPPGLHAKPDRLVEFLRVLDGWPEVRHGIEFRHESWFTAETASVLEAHRVANVISDCGKWPLWPAVTTDLAYVRLHGAVRSYASSYQDEDGLEPWVAKVTKWQSEGREVHVYFDNDAEGHAPFDALALRKATGL